MSIVECRAWSVACCESRVACRILLSLLATHAIATGLASGDNVVFRDNRVEFDEHAPYELMPDAGKEKQSPVNPEDRKEAQS